MSLAGRVALCDATVHCVREELRRALEKHPEGADLPALMKACGDLATVLMFERRATAGSVRHVASTKARYEAIQVAVIIVRIIEGI